VGADVVDSRLRSQIRFSPLLGTYQVTNVETGSTAAMPAATERSAPSAR